MSWFLGQGLLHRLSSPPCCGDISWSAGPAAGNAGQWRVRRPPRSYQNFRMACHQLWPVLKITYWNVQSLLSRWPLHPDEIRKKIYQSTKVLNVDTLYKAWSCRDSCSCASCRCSCLDSCASASPVWFQFKKKLIVNTSKYKILKLALVFFWTGSVFAGPVLRTLTTPYNYYNYLAAQLILPSLLLREVCTVSVGPGPCSSPACERAGTPVGPVRTDKIVPCSHVCQIEF